MVVNPDEQGAGGAAADPGMGHDADQLEGAVSSAVLDCGPWGGL